MMLDENDKAIIGQALRVAALNSTDYEEIAQYERVLHKLSWKDEAMRKMNVDGFRYDYDDSSDLM